MGSSEVETRAPLFEKSATEPKANLVRCKYIVNIVTSNISTLNWITKLLELTISAIEQIIDIISMQVYRFYRK